MFSAVGIGFAVGATEYTVGQAHGAGLLPAHPGVILTILGAIIAIKAMTSGGPGGDKIGKWAWKPLFFVIVANLTFGALLGGIPSIGFPSFGLLVAIFALVIIASFAGDKSKMKEVIILAIILAAGSYLAFVKLLALQFPVLPRSSRPDRQNKNRDLQIWICSTTWRSASASLSPSRT